MSYGRPKYGRPSFRSQIGQNARAQSLYYTGEKGAEHLAAALDAIPEPAKPRKASDPADTEGPVIHAVSQLLATHPKVLFAVRANSGALPYINAGGNAVPVKFNRIITKQPVRITDFWGWLRDGRPFSLEGKKPSWTKPRDQREFEQAAFLMMIRNLGGIGEFVRSADEANAFLNG